MGLFNRGYKMAIRYNDEVISIDMYNSLVSGLNITTPSYDFTDPKYNIPSNLLTALDTLPDKVFDDMSIDELTECKLNGNGVYDKLMTTARIHLKEEMDKGRITGAEYTNAYTQIVVSSMQQSVAFVTQMHQLKQSSIVSYYKTLADMVQAKLSAVTSLIQLEIQKINTQMSIAQVATIKAQFAHTVSQLGQADASYGLTHQQIASFVRKDQRSAAQFWADNWTVQKGIDEGLQAPVTFQNNNIQTVMAAVQKSHDLS